MRLSRRQLRKIIISEIKNNAGTELLAVPVSFKDKKAVITWLNDIFKQQKMEHAIDYSESDNIHSLLASFSMPFFGDEQLLYDQESIDYLNDFAEKAIAAGVSDGASSVLGEWKPKLTRKAGQTKRAKARAERRNAAVGS